MIEKIDRNFLAEKIEKLETHKYSPEQNKLHFTGRRFKISVQGCVTLESAIDKVLKNTTLLDTIAYNYFENEYVKWKILNKLSLTDSQLQDFIHEDYFTEVSKEEGEDRRWSRWITVVKQIDNRFFAVGYDKGLTEYQEDMYNEQPYEVIRTEKVVTKTVVSYARKENNTPV